MEYSETVQYQPLTKSDDSLNENDAKHEYRDKAGKPPYYTTIQMSTEKEFKHCTMVTSLISFFFCQCFGLAAIAMSFMGYADHKNKEYWEANRKLRIARRLASTAFVLGIVICVIYFIYLTLVAKKMMQILGNQNSALVMPSGTPNDMPKYMPGGAPNVPGP